MTRWRRRAAATGEDVVDDDALGLTGLDPDGGPDATDDADLPADVRPPRANRTIVVVAATAVVSLAAGIVLSQLVISPAQRAAQTEPPEAGAITVPVERQELSTDLTLRGDALYDDPVSVNLETAELGGPAIVTGQVPAVGDVVDAGQVVMEIAGRPVIVLPGELPVYRTLRIGSSGPDVTQLKEALVELGLDPGGSDVFDAATSAAVDALYDNSGYASPGPDEGAEEELQAARDHLRAAEEAHAQARAEVTRASSGAPQSERLRHNAAVAQAERAVQAAINGEEGGPTVAQARDELAVVRAERDEALAAPDVSGEVAARDAAAQAVQDASRAVDEAWRLSRTPLPAAEIVYVDTLPRRVDSVSVRRGDTVSGEALTISGATLQVLASVSAADAELVTEGMTAYLTVGDEEIEATVTEVTAGARRSTQDDDGEGGSGGTGGADRRQLVLVPEGLSEEQRAQIVGSNVRVSIPLESTGGEVLVVPVAALTAGPGGESRVEVDRGTERSEIVVVRTGLSAGGYVEITGDGLVDGDLVVVGR